MNSQNDITQLAERIHQAAAEADAPQGASDSAATADAMDLPPLPALPAFGALAVPDPVPLAEVSTMIPRAREKLKAGSGAPRILRPVFRNQGGFNGIIMETCNRLVEVSQQLRHENDALRNRLDTLTAYLTRQNSWLDALARRGGADRQAAYLKHDLARIDRAEVRLDHIEGQGDHHAESLARIETQNEHRDKWTQNLQAHVDEQHLRETEFQKGITQKVEEGHSTFAQMVNKGQQQFVRHDDALARLDLHHGQIRELREQCAGHAEHFRASDTRLDEMGTHLNSLQDQVHGQIARIDAANDHSGALQSQAEAQKLSLDEMGTHLNSLQDQVHGQIAHIDETSDRLNALEAQENAHTVQLDEMGTHLKGLQGQADGQIARVDEANDRARALHAQTEAHTARLDEIGTHLTSAQAEIGTHLKSLQSQVDGQIARVDEANDRAGALHAQTEVHTARLDEIGTHLTSAQTEIGTHLNSLQTQAHSQIARVDEAGDHIKALQAQTEAHTSRLDGMSSHLNSLQNQSHGQIAQIDQTRDRVGALEAQSGAHVSRLDAFGDSVNGLVTRCDANHDYTREIHGHLDRVGTHLSEVDDRVKWSQKHLDTLQTQADSQGTHLAGLQKHADAIGDRVNSVETTTGHQGTHLNSLQGHADRLGTHLDDLQGHNDRQGGRVDGLQRRLDEAVQTCEQARSELQVATSHQHMLEESSRRLDERQINDASYLRAQLSFHQRLFSHWLAPALPAPVGGKNLGGNQLSLEPGEAVHAPEGQPPPPPTHEGSENAPATRNGADAVARRKAASAFSEHEMDALYLAFEDAMRGKRSDIKERLSRYVPYLESAHVGSSASPVLDLGCGRGEWLEVLRENGIAAEGVDLNTCMIEQCRARRLQVTLANVIDFLAAEEDASYGAITAFHLIEHLPFPVLVQFFNECRRVLQPGGVAIFETPNPTNLQVGACFFYHDYTHQRPLPPLSTRFLVSHVGFAKVEVVPLNPWSEEGMVKGDGTNAGLVARFNELFYGPQDYAIVARTAGAGVMS